MPSPTRDEFPWGALLAPLRGARPAKPRDEGLTSVLDKSMGVQATRDFVESCGPYVDIVKLTSLTSLFYGGPELRAKIALLRDAGIEVTPGGTMTEVMLWQGCYEEFLGQAKRLGFTGIEVSDGTIEMDDAMRGRAVGRARDAGFMVVTEVGSKEWSPETSLQDMARDLARDLAFGASRVIVEAMEFGKGVGIVSASGEVSEDGMKVLVSAAGDISRIIFEAPIRQQQEFFVDRLGPNVNLGNIPPQEVLVLEATRLGLTGVPFMSAYLRSRGDAA